LVMMKYLRHTIIRTILQVDNFLPVQICKYVAVTSFNYHIFYFMWRIMEIFPSVSNFNGTRSIVGCAYCNLNRSTFKIMKIEINDMILDIHIHHSFTDVAMGRSFLFL
jgi:hypothetical protein